MKTIKSHLGTSCNYVEFELTGDAKRDITKAVLLEHPCNDHTGCDIVMALDHGFPFVAAYLLSGATETPLLDTVSSHYSKEIIDEDVVIGWEEWFVWRKNNTWQCECGQYNYNECNLCSNCLAIREKKWII